MSWFHDGNRRLVLSARAILVPLILAACWVNAPTPAQAGSDEPLSVRWERSVPDPFVSGHAGLYGWGAATMLDGTVLISDYRNYRVAHYGKDGTFLGDFAQNPGTAPYGLAVDPRNGDVYLADTDRGMIRKFNASGKPLLRWGGLGGGVGKFLYPSRVAVAGDGRVYVADTWSDEIVVHDDQGNELFTFGSTGTANGQLRDPHGMAFDGSDRLFVVDTLNFRVQVFDAAGNFLYKFGSKGTGPGQFQGDLRGLAIDDERSWVYVIDAAGNRVHKFDLSGTHIKSWGSTGSGPGQFIDGGREATVDGDGNLWVGDMPNYRAQKFSPNGEFLLEVPTTEAPPPDGGFNGPRGVALDGAGNIFVTDTYNQRVQKFGPDGAFVTKWGARGQGLYSFNYPRLLATDPRDGSIVVADTDNHLIKKFTTDGQFVWQAGGLGGVNGKFRNPQGVDVDPQGFIYVADSNNHRVQILDPNGAFVTSFGSKGTADGQLLTPRGIAVDPDGSIWVSDTSDVVTHFDPAGNYLGEIGGPGTELHQLMNPFDVESDGTYVYVADMVADKVKVWRTDGSFVTAFGNSDGYSLSGPAGLDLGPRGSLYVAEMDGERVSEWSTTQPPVEGGPTSNAIAPASSNSTSITVRYETVPGSSPIDSVELWARPPGGGSFEQVAVDPSPDSPSFSYSATAGDGAYLFYTLAKDAAGNYEPAPSTEDASTLIDTTAPAAPVFTSPPMPAGFDTQPSWSFEGEPGATFECSLHRSTTVIEGFAPCDSPKSYDLSGRADSVFKFLVRQRDAAGNLGPAATRFYRLDRSNPTSQATADPDPTSATFTITYTASDVGSGLKDVELWARRPGTTVFTLVATDTTIASPSFQYTPSAGDGMYSFYTLAHDKAGNYEAVPSTPDTSVVVDATAPSSQAMADPSSMTPTFAVTYSASDGGGEVKDVELWVRRPGTPGFALVATDTTIDSPSFEYTASAGDGTYSFYTRAHDRAGNYEAVPSTPDAPVVLDTTAPLRPDVLSRPITPWNSSFPTWTFDGESDASFECSLVRGTDIVHDFAPCAGSKTYDLTLAADGAYSFHVRQTDAAGNVGPARIEQYQLDRTTPSSVASAPASGRSSITIQYSVSDLGSGAAQVELWAMGPNDSAFRLVATDGSPGSPSFTYSTSTRGLHYFYSRARDAAGNHEGPPPTPDSSTRFK